MPKEPYRTLRILLMIFAVGAAVAGLLIIFGGKPLLVRMFLHPPESELSTLFLAAVKEMGGLILMLGLLFYFASRDPVRNVAIIDAFIAGLCVLAFTGPLSLYTLDLGRLYPPYMIWGRSVVRLALAALLWYLRPREAVSAGN